MKDSADRNKLKTLQLIDLQNEIMSQGRNKLPEKKKEKDRPIQAHTAQRSIKQRPHTSKDQGKVAIPGYTDDQNLTNATGEAQLNVMHARQETIKIKPKVMFRKLVRSTVKNTIRQTSQMRDQINQWYSFKQIANRSKPIRCIEKCS